MTTDDTLMTTDDLLELIEILEFGVFKVHKDLLLEVRADLAQRDQVSWFFARTFDATDKCRRMNRVIFKNNSSWSMKVNFPKSKYAVRVVELARRKGMLDGASGGAPST